MRNVTTVVGKMHRLHIWKCENYVHLITLNLSIVTKFFCGGCRKIEFDIKGGGNDLINQVVAISNPCTVLIWDFLRTYSGF